MARADSTVRTSLHQAQAQEASERFSSAVSSLQEQMVKALAVVIDNLDEEVRQLLTSLAESIQDCLRYQSALPDADLEWANSIWGAP